MKHCAYRFLLFAVSERSFFKNTVGDFFSFYWTANSGEMTGNERRETDKDIKEERK